MDATVDAFEQYRIDAREQGLDGIDDLDALRPHRVGVTLYAIPT